MKNKRILIVTSEFPPQPGGIGNHAYYLSLYLAKNGFEVSVIADQRDVDNEEEKRFDKALPFKVTRIALKRFRPFMYLNRIIKTLKAFKQADFVIATGKFSLWNVAFCSLFFKPKTLAVIHGSEVNFKSAGLKKAVELSLKRFDTLVAVSEYTAQLVAHLDRDIHVIPNGIELKAWDQTHIKSSSLEGSPVLTTVGRVSSRKGQLQVIKLLPELLKSFPKAHYHCIGIPTEAPAFIEEAKALGIDNRVTFHGALPDADLKAMLLATDIFVMLSTESMSGDVEGFGIAILEANALGVPAIGSTGCGIEDAINHGVSGFLMESHNGQLFTEHIRHILTDKETFKLQARTWAQQHDWNHIIKQYICHIS
ncbi:glycosyltransferase family 4 protein [Xanthomarina sp. F2636L]|uniref:glycosyltransferase family 4 protein n=1 Tax=Xanthomarina sp. F2636L TaxID=2996018 RepID=UPI00225E59B9|nr:glycosyltransferase family 4 protein [Xanthomarina sp. F2636L]MCX7549381.1 glycosyltransferase family 4 protein [Xanthomarina sp. F2636L]